MATRCETELHRQVNGTAGPTNLPKDDKDGQKSLMNDRKGLENSLKHDRDSSKDDEGDEERHEDDPKHAKDDSKDKDDEEHDRDAEHSKNDPEDDEDDEKHGKSDLKHVKEDPTDKDDVKHDEDDRKDSEDAKDDKITSQQPRASKKPLEQVAERHKSSGGQSSPPIDLHDGVAIAGSRNRKGFGRLQKLKMEGDRFEGKHAWDSGGYEAAEARRCAQKGCNPGFIVGYKDDPEEKNPLAELARPKNFRGPARRGEGRPEKARQEA